MMVCFIQGQRHINHVGSYENFMSFLDHKIKAVFYMSIGLSGVRHSRINGAQIGRIGNA
jgi:hypothetical protein